MARAPVPGYAVMSVCNRGIHGQELKRDELAFIKEQAGLIIMKLKSI
jgi:hypothetical protein